MDPTQASYDPSGNLVCKRCMATATVSTLDAQWKEDNPLTSKNLWGRSATSTALGCCTMFMLIFGVFAVLLGPIAVIMGATTLRDLIREPKAKPTLGQGWPIAMLLSGTGIALGVIGTGLGIAMFFLL